MRARPGVLEPAPPYRGADHGDGRGGWAWLVTAKDVFEAQLVQGLLENAGFPVMCDSFDRSPFAWMYPSGNVRRPVQIFVPASLLDAARLELLESSVIAAGPLPGDDAAPHSDGMDADAAPACHRRLLRDRIRPSWLIVALCTALVIGGFVLVEILNFAPCAAKIFCLGNDRFAPVRCDRATSSLQARIACTSNP